MGDDKQTPIAGLIALKLACCGGLLLATGAISAGSLLALVNHPAAKVAALVAVALGAWLGFRKWRARPSTVRPHMEMARSDDHNRNAA
jgi:hypothetical protein